MCAVVHGEVGLQLVTPYIDVLDYCAGIGSLSYSFPLACATLETTTQDTDHERIRRQLPGA